MPQIWGDELVNTARSALVALLLDLKAEIDGGGYSGAYTDVHGRHDVASLIIPSLSIGLHNATSNPVASNISLVNWKLEFSIRLHVAYTDMPPRLDEGDQMQVFASISNKLLSNENLGGNCRIADVASVEFNRKFEPSQTEGAEMIVTLTVQTVYAQE